MAELAGARPLPSSRSAEGHNCCGDDWLAATVFNQNASHFWLCKVRYDHRWVCQAWLALAATEAPDLTQQPQQQHVPVVVSDAWNGCDGTPRHHDVICKCVQSMYAIKLHYHGMNDEYEEKFTGQSSLPSSCTHRKPCV